MKSPALCPHNTFLIITQVSLKKKIKSEPKKKDTKQHKTRKHCCK